MITILELKINFGFLKKVKKGRKNTAEIMWAKPTKTKKNYTMKVLK